MYSNDCVQIVIVSSFGKSKVPGMALISKSSISIELRPPVTKIKI